MKQLLIFLFGCSMLTAVWAASCSKCTGGTPPTDDTCCIQTDATYICCGAPNMTCCYGSSVCCKSTEYCVPGNPTTCQPIPQTTTPAGADKCSISGTACTADQGSSSLTCCGTKCCPLKNGVCCKAANVWLDGVCCPASTQCAANGGCKLTECAAASIPCPETTGVCCGNTQTGGPKCCAAPGGTCCTNAAGAETGACCPKGSTCASTSTPGAGCVLTSKMGVETSFPFIWAVPNPLLPIH